MNTNLTETLQRIMTAVGNHYKDVYGDEESFIGDEILIPYEAIDEIKLAFADEAEGLSKQMDYTEDIDKVLILINQLRSEKE